MVVLACWCANRACVRLSTGSDSRPTSCPRIQHTIAAATKMLSWFGKLTVKEHVCPTHSGTSPESFHPFSERFQTVPSPWNGPALCVREHCTGER